MSRQKEAEKLLGPTKAAFLITSDESGQPDARAMAVAAADGLKTLWMMTGKMSDKYKQLSNNPSCMLYATDLEDTANYLELRLWGRIELLDDAESKSRAWRDDYLCYFPGGKEDPNLAVLKFVAIRGTLQSQDGKESLSL